MRSPWFVAHRHPPRAAGVLPVIAQAPGKVSVARKQNGAAGLVSDRPAWRYAGRAYLPVVNRVQVRFSRRVNSGVSARSGNSLAFTSADG